MKIFFGPGSVLGTGHIQLKTRQRHDHYRHWIYIKIQEDLVWWGGDELNFKYFEFEPTIEYLSIDTPFALRMVEVESKERKRQDSWRVRTLLYSPL